MTTKPYDWSVWQMGILFIVGLFAIWLDQRKTHVAAIPKIGYFLCAGAVRFAVFDVDSYFLGRREKVNLLNSDRCPIVEGVVTNFHPMPASGHGTESFEVALERFTYADYEVTPCFNHSWSHGGPIREALPLKIWYSDNCIMRIAAVP